MPKRNIFSRRSIFWESTSIALTYPATIFMVGKRVTYLNSAKPKLSSEPSFFARKSVFWKVPHFASRLFPRWKWYFRSNYDWKFSFLIPDGIPGKKSTILRILRENSQILQLVPRILKCTLVMIVGLIQENFLVYCTNSLNHLGSEKSAI